MKYLALTDAELRWIGKQAGVPEDPEASTRSPREGDMTAEGALALRDKIMQAQARDTLPLETAWNKAMRDGVYWFRRAEYAETALEEFVTHEASWHDLIELVDADDISEEATADNTGYIEHELAALTSAMAGANAVLAERRKEADDFRNSNFEDYIRDRRQFRVLGWAVRTFSEIEPLTDQPVESAFRFIEEALELWQAAVYAEEPTTEAETEFHARLDRMVLRVLEGNPGKPTKEAGQVAVTLMRLAQVLGFSLATEEKRELERIFSIPKSEWHARHSAKQAIGI